jgi:tRNA pseudouridine38-40 synthase
MAEAAQGLLGSQDFAAFAAPVETPGASTIRDLQRFDVHRRGPAIICDVVANAFLRHQVRRMVGALVEVGKGTLSVDAYVSLLHGPAASSGPTAPAHGLYLMGVEYAQELFLSGLDSESKLC